MVIYNNKKEKMCYLRDSILCELSTNYVLDKVMSDI